MNMKTSLIITGDSQAGQRAIDDLRKSFDQMAAASRGAIAPQRELANAEAELARGATGAAGSIEKEAQALRESARAANDNAQAHARAAQARVQAGGTIVTSAAQQRAAMQSLGAQLNDFSTQVLGGVSPMVAFTQQSGQVAYAMSGMGGVAGTVGRFLAGPFGSLVLIGATVLGTLAARLFDTADAGASAEKGLYAAARATDALASSTNAAAREQENFNRLRAAAQSLDPAVKREKDLNNSLADRAKLLVEINRIRQQLSRRDLTDDQRRDLYGRLDRFRNGDPGDPNKINLAALDQGIAAARANNATLSAREQALKDRQAASQARSEATRLRSANARAVANDNFASGIQGDISRIAAEFQGLPTYVDKARAATAKLDEDIRKLEQRKPPNFKQLIADANAAKQAIQDSITRPFDDFVQRQQESLAVGRLLAAGREDEASALRDIYQLQQQIGPLTEDQRATVLDLARQETAINDALEKRRELIGNYSTALSQIRGDLTSLLSGQSSVGDFFASYKKTFQQLQGKLLAENLFGDAFRQLQDFVEGRTGVTAAVDVMSSEAARAGSSAGRLADALDAAAGRVVGASPAGGGLEPYTQAGNLPPATVADLLRQVPIAGGGLDNDTQGAPIEVLGINPNGVNKLSASEFLQKTNDKLAGNLTGVLDKQFGTKFFSENLAKPISGALTGYATAGPVGAALGALKDLKGLPAGLQKGLSKGLEGAQTGTMVAGIGKALGIKMSSTGAQIGGAIGSALPIPGGQIIGSIIGGLAGGLFGSTPKGSATITGTGAKDVSVTGSEKYRTTLGAAADTIQGNLDRIAQALGGDATGAFSVSIGIRDGKYRVDPTGAGRTKKGKGVVDYGKDGAEAAVAAATADAIADGAIEGLSRAVQQAIKSSPNLDKSIAEALKVQDVELVLGGIGAVMERQFRDQERQAKERVRIATQYGFDVVAIEKKNAEERAALAEKLLQSQVGSLQNLVDELTRGSLFEGSGADQRTALLSAIDTAKADLAAGKDGAGDKLADLLGQLNSVSKDYYGSTGQFAADRSMILDQARTAIADSNARIAAAQSSSASDPALATTNQALDENNDQNAQMLTKQDEIIALLSRLGGGGGGGSPASGGSAIGFSELFNMARTK